MREDYVEFLGVFEPDTYKVAHWSGSTKLTYVGPG